MFARSNLGSLAAASYQTRDIWMNYKLTIQYDGSRYHGWQRQGNTDATIQGKLEGILSQLAGQPVEVQGAGRTDGGVHAMAQVASVKLPEGLSPAQVQDICNQYLPEDIAVTSVEEVPDRFHARLSAKGKVYCYRLRLGSFPDVFARKYQYRVAGPLDIAAMERAAALLTGTCDYRSFCANKRYKKSTVRTIHTIHLVQEGAELSILFRGTGFLHHMVRILVGTLLEVGLGQRAAEEMPAILEARDRQAAGKTAPAHGLCLMAVEYDKMV